MRRLSKGPKPDILKEKCDEWTSELLAAVASGTKPTDTVKNRYRHADVKQAVIDETHGKCAYCESKIRHIAPGDIEHIVPKSKIPGMAFEWENLTLACDVCNGNKGDTYNADPNHPENDLIDPYVDDPILHLAFFREVIVPRTNSPRAFVTNSILKLSRGELVERRRERMDFIDGLLRNYANSEPKYKSILLDDLMNNHLKDSDEYSASCNAYIGRLRNDGILP